MALKAVYKRRLLKLADLLERLPRKRFHFGSWASGTDLNVCGTTACALGWATTIPQFRRLGLCLAGEHYPRVALKGDILAQPADAANRVFGLYLAEHEYLFIPRDENHPECLPRTATPKQVARRIRRFVERDGEVTS